MLSSLPFSLMFLVIMVTGTLFSVSSIHWLAIWSGLEINLIGFLPVLVYGKKISESESAVKYFIIQAMGSSMLIFGSLIIYTSTFSWEMVNSGVMGIIGGFITLISGLFIKLGLFPFHYWLPSVMAGLSWLSCLLLTTWQKVAPLYLMVCLMELNQSYEVFLILCMIGAGSSVMGGLGGLNQTQVRALLAYSSIGHLGWIVFAIVHSEWVMKMYFAVYVMVSVCIFMSLWYKDSGMAKDLDNLSEHNFLQLGVVVLLLSLGGLPPMLGFISKLIVILVGAPKSYLFLMVMVIGSVMSLFYYLGLFFSMSLSWFKKYELTDMQLSNNALIPLTIMFNLVGGLLILSSNMFNSLYALVIFYQP
uniref:NADH-ubiquinone oxidoreductase chain 2 n=1 Tax=Cymbium olla TaxID=543401 RepID=C8XQU8_CYMOL|nr:NADH dehydrogenase subunit 2 [Cymbium olla]ACF04879.1 NADH dehydrogenase subunit 2 [Cymbium olla]